MKNLLTFSFYTVFLLMAWVTPCAWAAADDSIPIIHGERPPIDLLKVPADAYEKGVINIKFKNEFSGHLDTTPIVRAADGTVQFGLPAVDNLNRTHHAKNYRMLFSRKNDLKEFNSRHRSWGLHLWHTLELDSSADIKQIISEYQNLAEIEVAEPVYKKTLLWVPNDSGFAKQWHYHNTGQNGGTAGCDIHLPEAWDLTRGNPNVIVAVIDGGIKYDHPDLAGNMWQGRGYNFINGNTTITPYFHATHVAGTIAALTNNNIGVSGIAGGSGSGDGVRLMSCQVFTATTSGGFAQAFIYAADSGAAIAQNSWGYTSVGVYEQSVLNAIDYFNRNGGGTVLSGGITIFAAGNNNASGKWYPGCYSGVVAVAATNNNDVRSYYSNYDTWVALSAPGGEMTSDTDSRGVFSTYTSTPDTLYGFLQGTSMACPHVSGVAALVLSYVPGKLSAPELKAILLSSTDNIDAKNPGYAGKLGTGRLNAYKALLAAQTYSSPVISITVPGPGLIIFDASGYVVFSSASWYSARASLSLTNLVDSKYMAMVMGNSASTSSTPFEITRAMNVNSSGTYSVYLVGDMGSGSGATLMKNNASALFFPY